MKKRRHSMEGLATIQVLFGQEKFATASLLLQSHIDSLPPADSPLKTLLLYNLALCLLLSGRPAAAYPLFCLATPHVYARLRCAECCLLIALSPASSSPSPSSSSSGTTERPSRPHEWLDLAEKHYSESAQLLSSLSHLSSSPEERDLVLLAIAAGRQQIKALLDQLQLDSHDTTFAGRGSNTAAVKVYKDRLRTFNSLK